MSRKISMPLATAAGSRSSSPGRLDDPGRRAADPGHHVPGRYRQIADAGRLTMAVTGPAHPRGHRRHPFNTSAI